MIFSAMNVSTKPRAALSEEGAHRLLQYISKRWATNVRTWRRSILLVVSVIFGSRFARFATAVSCRFPYNCTCSSTTAGGNDRIKLNTAESVCMWLAQRIAAKISSEGAATDSATADCGAGSRTAGATSRGFRISRVPSHHALSRSSCATSCNATMSSCIQRSFKRAIK